MKVYTPGSRLALISEREATKTKDCKVTICVRQGLHILSISFLKPFHFLTVQFLTWPRYVPDQLALKKMIDEIGQGTERSDDQIVDVLKREQSGRKMILSLNE